MQRKTALAIDKRVQATTKVLNHVGHVREALRSRCWAPGVLTDPAICSASLMWAQEELLNAVEIIEKEWR